ncbi:MAG: hypothetical protein P4L44_11625 [Oryzomonas sp.]|uniref:hypothetical protein n=1 Tax=Oryzomonas sp. TaxID=2855186 RepID=UPI00284CC125|nr:hypothetical protein [Oryzomonas sp.]MDR3580601.1 hypothetical protein [Oryzomonas sp.]
MKRTILLMVVAALSFAVPMTGFAADGKVKDACLLNSDNCPNRSMSIVEIISKLKTEIAKGSSVYTPEELNTLDGKLSEYQLFLERMQNNS